MRALWIVAIRAPSLSEAGPCKYHHDWSLAPSLLTPAGATLDQFGGVVVAASSSQDKARGTEDPTQQDWWFSDGRDHAVDSRTVIAHPSDSRTMLTVPVRHADKAPSIAALAWLDDVR